MKNIKGKKGKGEGVGKSDTKKKEHIRGGGRDGMGRDWGEYD